MAVLESYPKHNMVAYSEKNDGNAEFHEIIDFLVLPSPRPSPTTHIPDSIPEDSGGNHGGQSSSDRSLLGNEGGMDTSKLYQAQEESQTCYYTPQSLDKECILKAKISRKEILEVKLDAKGNILRTDDDQDVGVDKEKNLQEDWETEEERKLLAEEEIIYKNVPSGMIMTSLQAIWIKEMKLIGVKDYYQKRLKEEVHKALGNSEHYLSIWRRVKRATGIGTSNPCLAGSFAKCLQSQLCWIVAEKMLFVVDEKTKAADNDGERLLRSRLC
ncbi:hypothetical protein Tco_0238244 [Tanacetum coccineum]